MISGCSKSHYYCLPPSHIKQVDPDLNLLVDGILPFVMHSINNLDRKLEGITLGRDIYDSGDIACSNTPYTDQFATINSTNNERWIFFLFF